MDCVCCFYPSSLDYFNSLPVADDGPFHRHCIDIDVVRILCQVVYRLSVAYERLSWVIMQNLANNHHANNQVMCF
jgi:hypothetical protein